MGRYRYGMRIPFEFGTFVVAPDKTMTFRVSNATFNISVSGDDATDLLLRMHAAWISYFPKVTLVEVVANPDPEPMDGVYRSPFVAYVGFDDWQDFSSVYRLDSMESVLGFLNMLPDDGNYVDAMSLRESVTSLETLWWVPGIEVIPDPGSRTVTGHTVPLFSVYSTGTHMFCANEAPTLPPIRIAGTKSFI